MVNLGKMQKIKDLRTVWPHEAQDFTKWLAEETNLQELSDAIGIDITLEERESPVGDFNVDLYAKESNTSRKIIIENQLEDTNHDHLGKLITYASGKGAEIIIWIVKRARDEHQQAIEWLNLHTDSNIGFFLVEIELWKIGDSSIAPKFNVVEKPNGWGKQMKSIEGMSDTLRLQFDFWQAFNARMQNSLEFQQEFSIRNPQPQNWYDLTIGRSAYFIRLSISTQKKKIDAGLYIVDSKDLFLKFKEHQEIFKKIVGNNVVFHEAGKSCRIYVNYSLNVNDTDKWLEAANWMLDIALKFKKVVREINVG